MTGSFKRRNSGRRNQGEDTRIGKHLSFSGEVGSTSCPMLGRGQNPVFLGKWGAIKCAIKRIQIVNGSHGKIGLNVEMSMRDLNALKELSSKNHQLDIPLVKYFGMAEDTNFRYIAFELFDGDLGQYIERRDPFFERPDDFHHLLQLARQSTEGIAFLRNRNWVHKDIKPNNYLVRCHNRDDAVQCKLADFGFAKRMVANASMATASTHLGTPIWIAPEVNDNSYYNAKSDVWSLGCVLYFIFTEGKHPFGEIPAGTQDPNMTSMLINIRNGKRYHGNGWKNYGMIIGNRNILYPKIDRIIDAMVAKSLDLRPTAQEVLEKLQATDLCNGHDNYVFNSCSYL